MDMSQFCGWVDDPEHREKFAQESKYPLFGAAAPWLKGSGKGKLSLPYKAVEKLSKNPNIFEEERQVGPDCVSQGKRNASDITRACDIDIRGDAEQWIARGATETIYGNRGHCGAGMSGSRGSQILTKYGVAIRKKYGKYDLSKYNYRLGNSWCPNSVPNEILEETKHNLFQTASLVRTVEELRDALANGYGADQCSNMLPSGRRDSKGFDRWGGSGGHCQAIGGCDDRDGNMDFLIINSWGKYESGGHPDWGQIPGSAYLIKAELMQRILNAGSTYVFSGFDGFPAQDLPDYGVGRFL